jgi:hypothetical protein
MAPDKQIGEYSFKSTSATLAPGPAGSVLCKLISKDLRPSADSLQLSSSRSRLWAAAKAKHSVRVRKATGTMAK